MPRGANRWVIFVGRRFAVKVPRPQPRRQVVLCGLRCNRWEREMWHIWRKKFGWETLCPILFADPIGLVVVMPRAAQPVTDEALFAMPEYLPNVEWEAKPEDCGYLNGRVVALDYGLHDADSVRRARANYTNTPGPAKRV